MKKILHLFLAHLFFTSVLIGQGLGNGSDGSPNISGIVNAYSYLVVSTPRCANFIEVNNTSAFKVNDLVLIIQMQGADLIDSNNANYGKIIQLNNTGNYEYAKVKSIVGSNIYLMFPLLRQYDVAGKVQVISVPQYQNPIIIDTLKCPKWNGTTGGVLAIDITGLLSLNKNIDVSGTGFRGGVVINGPEYSSDTNYRVESPSLVANALKGEGVGFDGIFPFTSGKGAPANAGGGGNSHTAGGGGGANFGCGGKGGWGFPSDAFYQLTSGLGGYEMNYNSSENKVYMGAGGGAGSVHANEGTGGGTGGGIVLITADNIVGNGFAIVSKGDSSLSTFSNFHADGIGGAGAGGTVILSINNISSPLNINVDGGDGGESSKIGAGPGGGGGGGLVWFSSSVVPVLANISLNGGVGGKANSTFYGAVDGCDGGVKTGVKVPLNNLNSTVNAAFIFSELQAFSYNFTNTSSGMNTYLWSFGDGSEDTIANPLHVYDQSGIFPVTLFATDTSNCRSIAKNVIITSVSNIFTPNGDGINDNFSFVNLIKEGLDVKIQIFNRWGVEVFAGNKNNSAWDGTNNGKKVPAGTYYYIISILVNNEYFSEDQMPKTFKGTITLLR